jgi:hypothetical protein
MVTRCFYCSSALNISWTTQVPQLSSYDEVICPFVSFDRKPHCFKASFSLQSFKSTFILYTLHLCFRCFCLALRQGSSYTWSNSNSPDHACPMRQIRTFTTSAIVDKNAVSPDHADGGTSIRRRRCPGECARVAADMHRKNSFGLVCGRHAERAGYSRDAEPWKCRGQQEPHG